MNNSGGLTLYKVLVLQTDLDIFHFLRMVTASSTKTESVVYWKNMSHSENFDGFI